MPVVVHRPAPPLDGLITAITYRAGQQLCTSVEKILPGPETGLWVNLNRDEFRSLGVTGQVNRVPGAMIAGPASRASVIEFEAGHAHVSVTFALAAARCFVGPPMDLMRDDMVPLEELWGRSGGCLRERPHNSSSGTMSSRIRSIGGPTKQRAAASANVTETCA